VSDRLAALAFCAIQAGSNAHDVVTCFGEGVHQMVDNWNLGVGLLM
jgi:hypothetical protein